MVTSNLNDPDDLLAYLSRPLRAIRDGYDHGASYADTILGQRSPHDDHFWAHAARWQARQYLDTATKEGWQLGRQLPNTGVELRCGPTVLRVLRRYQGGPPPPGSSKARLGYYAQEYTPEPVLALVWSDGVQLPDSCNLIVDWALGKNKHLSLALSKPIGVWKFKGQPKLEWRREVFFDPADEPRFMTGDETLEVPRYDETELGSGEEDQA
jgi:hypothetical protein